MLETDEIIAAIRTARRASGLSQQALGRRIGVPQSHISKIEGGGVDIQLSSLVQIARALDLEIVLIPRQALPAVESLVAGVSADRTAPALAAIRKARARLDRFAATAASDTIAAPLEALGDTLKSLQALRYDAAAFARLSQALAPAAPLGTALDHLDRLDQASAPPADTPSADTHPADTPSADTGPLRRLNRALADLRKLRNALAHGSDRGDPLDHRLDRPAYTLEGDDE